MDVGSVSHYFFFFFFILHFSFSSPLPFSFLFLPFLFHSYFYLSFFIPIFTFPFPFLFFTFSPFSLSPFLNSPLFSSYFLYFLSFPLVVWCISLYLLCISEIFCFSFDVCRVLCGALATSPMRVLCVFRVGCIVGVVLSDVVVVARWVRVVLFLHNTACVFVFLRESMLVGYAMPA